MSVDAVMARITAIQGALAPAAPAPTPPASSAGGSVQMGRFASLLGQAAGSPQGGGALGVASPPAVTGAAPVAGATDAGSRMIALAQGELAAGVAEQPPGSNDGPRIAQYRAATAGSGVGPWCAYFTSWLAQQAGTPVGEAGQGFGSVDALRGMGAADGPDVGRPRRRVSSSCGTSTSVW